MMKIAISQLFRSIANGDFILAFSTYESNFGHLLITKWKRLILEIEMIYCFDNFT